MSVSVGRLAAGWLIGEAQFCCADRRENEMTEPGSSGGHSQSYNRDTYKGEGRGRGERERTQSERLQPLICRAGNQDCFHATSGWVWGGEPHSRLRRRANQRAFSDRNGRVWDKEGGAGGARRRGGEGKRGCLAARGRGDCKKPGGKMP